jgi:hypothetical protein
MKSMNRFVARKRAESDMAAKAQEGSLHEAENMGESARPDVSSVHVHHDHADGRHTVISHGPDGMQVSEHSSAREAHEEATNRGCQQGPRDLQSDMDMFGDTYNDNLA